MKEHKKDVRILRLLALLLCAALVFPMLGCDYVFSLLPDESSPETTGEDIVGDESTDEPIAETTTPVETLDPNETVDTAPEETTTPPETNEQGEIITYIDPLTGLRVTEDYSQVRPISLIYDNISVAAPQSGISKMDILIGYPNFWIPPGILITLAILAFNFVGDGLRDAFDPKMKR